MEIIKNFVQDKFFTKGNFLLKLRESITTLLLWALLIGPIVVLINSLNTGGLWQDIYFWTYQDGFALAQFIEWSIVVGLISVFILSVLLLLRNNHYVTKVLTKQTTYNIDGLKKRSQCIENTYQQRFGEQSFRESVKYYIVKPEQNFDNHLIRDTFKKEGCDFK